ncbi:MAG: ribonuclease [Anaerolineae bacterium]|nr:ribonuclease [Anaerolineae bacterium]MBT7072246.1 ribonuclease [Anaerolineae bacterium]MBT7601040.1 ribonuclease [Anaerolineae bacterium]MBT7990673.1 ribonuclease [Anaerolineae bacterium]
MMALSWSPDYCASNGSNDPQQCSIGKKLDFVLHGLWPQYESGYPSYCSTESMDYDLIDEYWGLYPSEKLFDHEWEKHGTCTGLTPEGYLLWSQELKEGLEIPAAFDSPLEPFRTDAEELKEAFIETNPEFSEDSFAVYCSDSGRFLKEIFVCYEKDGDPRACSGELLKKASKSCGQPDFLVRNTR